MRNPFGFAQNMGIYPDFCGIFNGVIIFMTMEWNGFPIFQLIQYPESIYGETTARQDKFANSFVPTSLGGGVTRGWQIHEKNEGLWLGNNIHQMVNLSAMFDHTGGYPLVNKQKAIENGHL
jgi:hypothetical protein